MILGLVATLLSPTVELAAVGDVMLARWVAKRIEREGPAATLKGAETAFAGADVRVGNLECVIGEVPLGKRKAIMLKAPSSTAAALKGRFDVLTLANNHALDCGLPGLASTQRWLDKLGIQSCGIAGRETIMVRKGLRIGFIGLSQFDSGEVNSLASWKLFVAALRPKVDVLVVMVHWGLELSPKPTPLQDSTAREMVASGVDLILGSHPHVLQPVEKLEEGSRKGWVAYSLGDFVFDSPTEDRRRTAVLRVRLGMTGVERLSFVPCQIQRGFPVAEKATRPITQWPTKL